MQAPDDRFPVPVLTFDERFPGYHFCNGCFLRFQHKRINSFLLRGKLPVHRNGAGNISTVVPEFSACIHKQEITIFHLPVVGRIVKSNTVWPRADNRLKGRHGGTILPENKFDKGFDLKFVQSGTANPANIDKCIPGNINRFPDPADLIIVL